jgi:hypothetical protein
MAFTGKDLLDMGYSPGSWFKDAIAVANRLLEECKSLDEIRPQIDALAPAPFTALRAEKKYGVQGVFDSNGSTSLSHN